MCIVLTSRKYPKGGPDRKRERCKVRRTPFDIPHVRSISPHRVISTESCIALLHETCSTTRCPITRAAAHVAASLYICRGKMYSYFVRLWASIDLRAVFYFVINSVARCEKRVEQPVSDSYVYVFDLLISYSWTVHKSERKIREKKDRQISPFYSTKCVATKCIYQVCLQNSLDFPWFLTYI